jgi:hypothetical protein
LAKSGLDAIITVHDSLRNLFERCYSCLKYNSMSSIEWYNEIFCSSNYARKNGNILDIYGSIQKYLSV